MTTSVLRKLKNSTTTYLSIWWNRLIKLVVLNLLTLACSLTIVLIPSAIAALNSVILAILEYGDSEEVVKEYFQALKANFKFATLPGFLGLALIVVPLYSIWFYMIALSPSVAIFLNAVLLALVVLAWTWTAYFFVYSAQDSKPIRMRDVAVVMLYNSKSTLKLATPLLFILVFIVFFPYLFPFILIVGISSIQLMICMILRKEG